MQKKLCSAKADVQPGVEQHGPAPGQGPSEAGADSQLKSAFRQSWAKFLLKVLQY